MLAVPSSVALGPSFLDPHWLISTFGLVGILALVFAESGLLIGFFLPGDSLLFTAGLLVADGTLLHQPLWLLCLLVCVAAVAGDQVGYAFGRPFRAGAVPPAGLARLQAGESAQGTGVLRSIRCPLDRVGAVRADRADLHADRGGR